MEGLKGISWWIFSALGLIAYALFISAFQSHRLGGVVVSSRVAEGKTFATVRRSGSFSEIEISGLDAFWVENSSLCFIAGAIVVIILTNRKTWKRLRQTN